MSSAVGERRRRAWVAVGVGAGAALCGRVDTNVLRRGNLSKCGTGHEIGVAKWATSRRRQGAMRVRRDEWRIRVVVVVVNDIVQISVALTCSRHLAPHHNEAFDLHNALSLDASYTQCFPTAVDSVLGALLPYRPSFTHKSTWPHSRRIRHCRWGRFHRSEQRARGTRFPPKYLTSRLSHLSLGMRGGRRTRKIPQVFRSRAPPRRCAGHG